MSEPRHLDLVDRLRGQYHLPVNDGAGPLNGSMTFSREFPTPPIQKEAAAEIERLRTHIAELNAKMTCMCGSEINHSAWEGHSPVSMFDHAVEQEVERRIAGRWPNKEPQS